MTPTVIQLTLIRSAHSYTPRHEHRCGQYTRGRSAPFVFSGGLECER